MGFARPHWLLFCLMLALTPLAPASGQFGSLFGTSSKVPTIKVEELSKLLEQQQQAEEKAKQEGQPVPEPNFVVVDVRSEPEVNVSVIPGAITKKAYEENRDDYAGRVVIPYCTIGGRSGRYAQQLADSDVPVKNFKGSILEWVNHQLPLVTLEGKPTNRVHIYSDRYKIPEKYEAVTK
ncbi:rhodanese-like domain-containing protein [Roseiconus nitratireducens]|nr:rhodanese-like domain-containing protein [Roseiconus nitratireducens]